MAMTFAERMALRKAGLSEAPPLLAPPTEPSKIEEEPKVEEKPTRKWGKPPEEPKEEEEKEKEEKDLYPLSRVITMANAATGPTDGELLIDGDIPEEAIRIKQRIAMLGSIEEGALKSEMDELKRILKATPQACQYLLPEELGECVRALRRMTDNRVAQDLGRARPKKAAKEPVVPKLTAEDLNSIEW